MTFRKVFGRSRHRAWLLAGMFAVVLAAPAFAHSGWAAGFGSEKTKVAEPLSLISDGADADTVPELADPHDEDFGSGADVEENDQEETQTQPAAELPATEPADDDSSQVVRDSDESDSPADTEDSDVDDEDEPSDDQGEDADESDDGDEDSDDDDDQESQQDDDQDDDEDSDDDSDDSDDD